MNRLSQRRGFTLVELTISMAVTAFIGLAVAMILQTASYGTSNRRDVRRIAIRAEVLRDRINETVRKAACFLAVGNGYLVIWQGDRNKDLQVNLSELQFLELNSGTQTLTSYTAALPVGTDTAYAVNSDFYAVVSALKTGGSLTGVGWATGVSGLTFTLDDPTAQQAVLVTWSTTLTNGALSEPISGTATLRVPVAPQ